MKFTVHKLRVGDQVWAQILERVTASEYIVSFQGDLVRVRNESLNTLGVGEKVLVRVLALSPLAFQLVSNEEAKRGANRINVNV